MSIQSLIDELKSAKNIDIASVRERIYKEFDAAATSDQRGTLLALFKAATDQVERTLVGRADQAQMLEDFRKARDQDYKIFIVKECTVGLDAPVVGGDISVDMLMAVTNREIEAGRMTEEHSLRKIAVEGASALHLSHAELVAKHANRKAEAPQALTLTSTTVVNPAGDKSETSSAVGGVLWRTLKWLRRK